MLSVNALDFMNYNSALKGNYRKGVHVFRCILENPTQAADFAANLGGVCVVFGVPIGQDDRNSQQLLALLQASSVIDQAALTWVSQWYPDYADDWDTMAPDADRAGEMAGNELIWRAVGSSPVGAGKVIASIAGLNCQDYADMTAVAASSTAMAAVAASSTAMTAVAASSTAMTAVASSYVAVAAVYGSTVAVDTIKANETAWATLTGASSEVMGKAVAILAGLNPDSYADMTAVAASSTAMAAVAASSTAMTAVAASTVAVNALNASALKQTYTVTSAGTGTYVIVKSGGLLVLSLLGTGASTWTAKNFTVPDTNTVTFNTTAVSLCKTANNLQVAYGSSSTSQTATITGIPV